MTKYYAEIITTLTHRLQSEVTYSPKGQEAECPRLYVHIDLVIFILRVFY